MFTDARDSSLMGAMNGDYDQLLLTMLNHANANHNGNNSYDWLMVIILIY